MAGLEGPGPVQDIFESSLTLEESHFKEGYEEGFENGIQAGKVEGREVGLKNGFQAGEEIGFYHGCVSVWKRGIELDSSSFSQRAQRTIKQLETQLASYPLTDPEEETTQDSMEAIRVKFQTILSMLSVHLSYPGHPRSQDAVDTSDF